MDIDYGIVGQFFIAMLSILNPIGAIPVYISMTEDLSRPQRKSMTRACSIAVFITITVSLLLGSDILKFFGISIPSFTVGGGVLLFTMALSMIQAKNVEAKMNTQEITESSLREIGIVPLAIPLLSGPGTISTSIIYSKNFHSTFEWIAGIALMAVLSTCVYFVLINADKIRERLGDLGVNVMTRIMGLILLAMSVEMMVGGLKKMIPLLNS
ncbi:MarC family protein [Bacteriovorax sp. Seq25_V]|uniref:MarC family protein n=1 Tax=Bacteriovorax sp. Seq25_V TaxID=1201288 RepID=UPI000389DFDE|nr:MarC family protein [Bacteriovorax sp. Seq25_V]EQC46074.1 membrane protein, MarC family [Bacteriovorax sp. Seq25_V]